MECESSEWCEWWSSNVADASVASGIFTGALWSGGVLVQVLQALVQVLQKAVGQGTAEVLPHEHAQHRHVAQVGCHGVRRHHPPELLQVVSQVVLVELGLVLSGTSPAGTPISLE